MAENLLTREPLRVAIVGTAARSEYLYGPILRALSNEVALVAVWGRSVESARRLGESLDVPWHTDLERLIRETAPALGIVSVASRANGEVGLMAVEHGLHVLLETPIAQNLREADRIIEVATARGLKTEVAEQFHRRVCEKSGRAGSGDKEAEGFGGAGAEVLPEGGDLCGAGTADEGEHEIAAGGHDLGGRTAAQGGAILAKRHVTQPVATFNAPVAPNEREQAVGVGVAGREAGDEIDRFRRRFLGRTHRADEAGDLGDAREGKIGA